MSFSTFISFYDLLYYRFPEAFHSPQAEIMYPLDKNTPFYPLPDPGKSYSFFFFKSHLKNLLCFFMIPPTHVYWGVVDKQNCIH